MSRDYISGNVAELRQTNPSTWRTIFDEIEMADEACSGAIAKMVLAELTRVHAAQRQNIGSAYDLYWGALDKFTQVDL